MSDTYKETKEFHFDNAVLRVRIPELTEEEKQRRLKNIHDAAAKLLMKGDQK